MIPIVIQSSFCGSLSQSSSLCLERLLLPMEKPASETLRALTDWKATALLLPLYTVPSPSSSTSLPVLRRFQSTGWDRLSGFPADNHEMRTTTIDSISLPLFPLTHSHLVANSEGSVSGAAAACFRKHRETFPRRLLQMQLLLTRLVITCTPS